MAGEKVEKLLNFLGYLASARWLLDSKVNVSGALPVGKDLVLDQNILQSTLLRTSLEKGDSVRRAPGFLLKASFTRMKIVVQG